MITKDLRKKMSGQMVLIVLLASAVVMTMGLSLSKKSTTETKIDTDEELLKQAFNTAESGIDYYLATGTTGVSAYSSPDGKSVADVTIKDIGNTSVLDFGEYTFQNTGSFFWLAAHDEDGNVIPNDGNYTGSTVDICVNSDFSGALKIDYFYNESGVYKVKRWGYNLGGGSTVNNFETKIPGACSDGRYKYTFDLIDKPILLVLTPIFNSAKLALVGTGNFPIQGQEISSIGRIGDITNTVGVNRSVKGLNRYKLPMFMLEGITAAGNIVGGT
ncbi:MAG: hypothetical protein Q8P53_01265 [Candidatus Shapirobacteria bacterium]|nr:hypothetical protein [Candidatus Shapirobacteria bacterium]